jgi:uncharacterized protein YfaQ (DUF2300 family)
MNTMFRIIQGLCGLAACATAQAAMASPPPTRLAWLEGDQVVSQDQATRTSSSAVGWRAPLGSTWKLFVYGYLHAKSAQEPAYICNSNQRLPDEEYCCEPGESINRDQALERSCGLYFSPQRLQLSAQDWSQFWRSQQAPSWLNSLAAMQPDTEVAVTELLGALRIMPAAQRIAARQALLPVNTRDEGVLAALGSGPRFKTWSWRINGERAGGAAGWRSDGSPFWFAAPGTSRTALKAHAEWIASQWNQGPLRAADPATEAAQPCIVVDFFRRYPIRSVRKMDRSEAATGPMNGRYQVAFDNGRSLPIEAVPSLQLQRDEQQRPLIMGRLTLEDYVARVIDREGNARETQAARALAIAARTYVLQNATEDQGCRRIADDSRAQRVSPNPPSLSARAAARFTEGLVIKGHAVRYHADQASPGVMAWTHAVAQGRSGQSFASILREAYPAMQWGSIDWAEACTDLPQASHWLVQRQARWRPVLQKHVGFEPPGNAIRVCQLSGPTPHSDQRRLIIRVREWQTREGRVTLIHEYLHLAFRDHPNGRNEAFVEQLAQKLADL